MQRDEAQERAMRADLVDRAIWAITWWDGQRGRGRHRGLSLGLE